MSDPIAIPSNTPNLNLPLLVPGQAQKEFFINEALGLLDALQPRVVTASQPVPPASPVEGDCFRVTSPATGAWSGHAGCLAVMVGGDWHFISPALGMTVFDKARGHLLVFRSGWVVAQAPVLPSGGATIDIEARAAIGALIEALGAVGILATAAP